MEKEVIDFNLKKKVYKLKKNNYFRLLDVNIEKVLQDVIFFKQHALIVEKSEFIFKKSEKNDVNYLKSIELQQDYVEELCKMG